MFQIQLICCVNVDLKNKNIIYASSSSVYGNPKVKSKIDEKHNISPNSCARTKIMKT